MKRIIAFLMITTIAGAALAFEDKVDLANIDKNLRLEQMKEKASEPVVKEKYEYYEISGADEKELRRQMSRNGTPWDDGKTYDSVTTWNVKWDYDYNCSSLGCTVDSFKTVVNVVFRYPKWVRTDDAPQPLIAKWDNYMNNLIIHENGHRDMAVEAAAQLSRTVVDLPAAPSSAELDRQVEALSKQLMAKMSADQKAYDETTKHGTTQGAVFP